MCLLLSNIKTEALKRSFDSKENKTLDFWKIYRKNDKSLSCIFRKNKIRKPGIIASDRKSKRIYKDVNGDCEVNKGIHVYTSKRSAIDNLWWGPQNEIAVRVQAKKEDLVAASDLNEAVFMKITIPQEEWNEIFNK